MSAIKICCAYCPRVLESDHPVRIEAVCWACWIRMYYELPKLPWWAVSP